MVLLLLLQSPVLGLAGLLTDGQTGLLHQGCFGLLK